ncbi:hypothetical protein [Escherichia coli]|uniref:hypothetical protein n=1 Tax=Escherichia coli TaxID=562 RepID=UPI000B24EE3B|nr:hypothetical protein [Escherichia coli]MCP8805329.1 hypothetical protein [Escherichia coli]MCT6260330.1 hypothetical protein [Escherichia coli]MCT6497235.1 hypothetical protein [Escherichia coli]MCW9813175.1 hypothetical protein [Escherichia coli]MCW9946392.1 hypothetical protein [Escherichia coli]
MRKQTRYQTFTADDRKQTCKQFGDRLDDVEKMERCRRELEALKRIDSAVYSKRKAEFDKLVSGASLYNGVRSEVGNYTQSAVDALYRFRSDKLCADIASDVLLGLTK